MGRHQIFAGLGRMKSKLHGNEPLEGQRWYVIGMANTQSLSIKICTQPTSILGYFDPQFWGFKLLKTWVIWVLLAFMFLYMRTFWLSISVHLYDVYVLYQILNQSIAWLVIRDLQITASCNDPRPTWPRLALGQVVIVPQKKHGLFQGPLGWSVSWT